MSPDQSLAIITLVGVIGTVANVWITLSIQKSILGLKLWTRENFIPKEDMPRVLQLLESGIRIHRDS